VGENIAGRTPNTDKIEFLAASNDSAVIDRDRSGDKLLGFQSDAGPGPPAAVTFTDSRNNSLPRLPRNWLPNFSRSVCGDSGKGNTWLPIGAFSYTSDNADSSACNRFAVRNYGSSR
jgi:hypothetical protein